MLWVFFEKQLLRKPGRYGAQGLPARRGLRAQREIQVKGEQQRDGDADGEPGPPEFQGRQQDWITKRSAHGERGVIPAAETKYICTPFYCGNTFEGPGNSDSDPKLREPSEERDDERERDVARGHGPFVVLHVAVHATGDHHPDPLLSWVLPQDCVI